MTWNSATSVTEKTSPFPASGGNVAGACGEAPGVPGNELISEKMRFGLFWTFNLITLQF